MTTRYFAETYKGPPIEIKWKQDKEPSMENCEFCGDPARWRRPYLRNFAPHTQTYWLTLCDKCDEHQRERNQELMKRLGYHITFHPDTFKHRIRPFYL